MGTLIECIGGLIVVGLFYIIIKGSIWVLAEIFPTMFAIFGFILLIVFAIKEEGCGCGCLVIIGLIILLFFA